MIASHTKAPGFCATDSAGMNAPMGSRKAGWWVTSTLAFAADAARTAATPRTRSAGSPTESPVRSHSSASSAGYIRSSAFSNAPTVKGAPGFESTPELRVARPSSILIFTISDLLGSYSNGMRRRSPSAVGTVTWR